MEQKTKKGKKLSIRILRLTLLPLLILAIVTSVVTVYSMTKNLNQLVYSNLYGAGRGMEIALSQSSATFEKEEVASLFSMLAQDTGYHYTMYLKDKVHSSSIKVNGQMLSQNLDAKIYDHVAQGNYYMDKNVVIDGTKYIGLYYPVEQDGEVFGVMFCAMPMSQLRSIIMGASAGTVIISIIMLAIAAVIAYFFALKIGKAIKAANESVTRLSNGDLRTLQAEDIDFTSIAKRSDELGEVVSNVMNLQDKLFENVSSIKENYTNLLTSEEEIRDIVSVCNTTSNEISNAVDEISQGSVTQAEELDNANKQVTTMEDAIDHISDNIKHSANVVSSMVHSSNNTRTAFDEFMETGRQTAESIDKIGDQIQSSVEASNEIVRAVEMINDIASQTSLLSLNASIEAARAGEAGRGFAVVAEEIQKLSDQSAASAQDIREVIGTLTVENNHNVEMANELRDMMQRQTVVMEQSTKELLQLLDYISQIKKVLDEIESDNVVVTKAKTDLVTTIKALMGVAENNAASSEETTASMQEFNSKINALSESTDKLHDMAENLNKQIAFYTI